MRIMLAGAAVVALAASGAYAQPNKDNGKGNSGGHEGHQPSSPQGNNAASRGTGNNGGGNTDHSRGAGHAQPHSNSAAPNPKTEARGNADRRDNQADNRDTGSTPHHPQAQREQAQGRNANLRNQATRSQEPTRGQQGQARDANGNNRNDRADNNRATGNRGNNRQTGTADARTFRYDNSFYSRDHARSIATGCPPGLAKRNNGCTPPGQINERSPVFGYTYRPSLFGLSHYGSGRYYYDDGYLVRLANTGGIAGYIPLLGGALAIGNAWPSSYSSYALPDYYVDYYDLGDPRSYRYADNVVYRVDPKSAAITSIAALLTGDDFTVGQPMPLGYDVYNVPYAYRDRYYDTPDAHYRYADGYVYRVDPETQLIAAVINLLV